MKRQWRSSVLIARLAPGA
jgi:hypothetical protein